MQSKFMAGTSQDSLLRNRIRSLTIAKALIMDEDIMDKYSKEELTEAIRPVSSIISKCEKAQRKFSEGTSNHIRFKKMIQAMQISKTLITDKIGKSE